MAGHPQLGTVEAMPAVTLGDPPLGGTRRRIGAALGLRHAGLSHFVLGPGERPFPVHLHLDEEETAYVLAGAGLLWLGGAAHELRAGDAISHLPGRAAQAYVGGPDGMTLVVLSSPLRSGLVLLPRIGVAHARSIALDGGGSVRAREAALGPLELPDPSPRPDSVRNVADCPAEAFDDAGYEGEERDLGTALGVERAGLRHVRLAPGALSCPPHWHTTEEECFLVLEGDGVAWLGEERLALAPGSVLARPANTRVAHALEAGASGLTYLSLGTRDPGDVAYYPRSGKLNVGGLCFRVEPVDYWEGERGGASAG